MTCLDTIVSPAATGTISGITTDSECLKYTGLYLMLESYSTKNNHNDIAATGRYDRELGNSDRIRQKFGAYGIEVLENDARIRVSNLYSIHHGVKTNRTFAVVAYAGEIQAAFSKEHKAIIGGQSIGIVFKKNGWAIDKRHQYFGKIDVRADQSRVDSVFRGIGSCQPAVHIYTLFVKKNNAEYQYASIAEVHHPEYLALEDLQAIYGKDFERESSGSRHFNDFLEIVKSKLQYAA